MAVVRALAGPIALEVMGTSACPHQGTMDMHGCTHVERDG